MNMQGPEARSSAQISSSNFRILSRKVEGAEILFQLDLTNDPTNVCAVHECSLRDLFKYVSPDDLNDFENHLYEEEYQEELLLEKPRKRRGRPPGIPVNAVTTTPLGKIRRGRPPGIPIDAVPTVAKIKAPRGRPRKTPLESLPVESTEASSTASDESASNDEVEDLIAKRTPLVIIPSALEISRKRKLNELHNSSGPLVSTSNAVQANMSMTASGRSAKSSPFTASPDNPTPWEKKMMARYHTDIGSMRKSRHGKHLSVFLLF